jgi:predicted DNA-binding transcriptional regulator YafY
MTNISQITLDVIDAVKKKRHVMFSYNNEERIVKPTKFFGDFEGFEGTNEQDEFKRFRLDRVSKWQGLTTSYKVHIEPISFSTHPNLETVLKKVQALIDSEQLLYGVEIDE